MCVYYLSLLFEIILSSVRLKVQSAPSILNKKKAVLCNEELTNFFNFVALSSCFEFFELSNTRSSRTQRGHRVPALLLAQ